MAAVPHQVYFESLTYKVDLIKRIIFVSDVWSHGGWIFISSPFLFLSSTTFLLLLSCIIYFLYHLYSHLSSSLLSSPLVSYLFFPSVSSLLVLHYFYPQFFHLLLSILSHLILSWPISPCLVYSLVSYFISSSFVSPYLAFLLYSCFLFFSSSLTNHTCGHICCSVGQVDLPCVCKHCTHYS